jgi:tRNA G18 (ribose-2'-O)-methylase SpoU
MGVLARNCAAFGVQALIVGETCTTPFLRRAVRNPGNDLQASDCRDAEPGSDFASLRERGLNCIAAHPHAQQVALPRCDFRTDCCIVLGSEQRLTAVLRSVM